ncbi:differentially expressed in FDCP 8 homolog [Culicoides brevitarsis]|uniref:differentially expressed in FDCP 8 homolog n=1 Tax=Culicoides brevitarsis TaxID=469753 RepID=UPI00307CB875
MKSLRGGIQCILSQGSSDSSQDSQKSQAIPTALIKEDWQLILNQDASIEELRSAVEKCKELVLKTEECSYERTWIVRHLCELRLRLQELVEIENDPNETSESARVVLGHHFIPRHLKDNVLGSTKVKYCDFCTGIIWNVIQASFFCVDCQYIAHARCVDHVTRICANITASERVFPEERLRPETGMHMQAYKCADCKSNFQLTTQDEAYDISPRLCEYSGNYFCPCCHWNDVSIVPARITHNWDFKLYRVSRSALQEINLFMERAVIRLEEKNPKLFIFVQALCQTKKLRHNLSIMKKYLTECRFATEKKILDNELGMKRHLALFPDVYSIQDLVNVHNGSLLDQLHKMSIAFEQHIRNCEICKGKGYICEICGHNEPLFPFDDGGNFCQKCNSMCHRSCWMRKEEKCKKCERLQKRAVEKSASQEEQEEIELAIDATSK